MPWKSEDVKHKTKKAKSKKKKREWVHVANRALAAGSSEGSAIRMANAVVAGKAKHRKKKRRRALDSERSFHQLKRMRQHG